MNLAIAIPVATAGMMLIMFGLWLRQRFTHNAGVVDVAWTFGTAALGVTFALAADGWEPRRWLISTLIVLWAARLGGHILARVMSGAEDGRYRMTRETWGDRTQTFLFWFFQLQAWWSMLFALPLLIAASNPHPQWTLLDGIGVTIWIIAIVGETTADRQLAKFRSDQVHRGQVCREGLWRYSRHPNYFFEWIHWFAYLAIALAGGWTWGWLALCGPVLMFVFVTRITGIPPTEAQALRSRGDAYRAYQRTTSAFFPWPPRPAAASNGAAAP